MRAAPVNRTRSDGPAFPDGVLPLPVGLALDDEFVGRGLQPVHGRLSQEWVGLFLPLASRGSVVDTVGRVNWPRCTWSGPCAHLRGAQHGISGDRLIP